MTVGEMVETAEVEMTEVEMTEADTTTGAATEATWERNFIVTQANARAVESALRAKQEARAVSAGVVTMGQTSTRAITWRP